MQSAFDLRYERLRRRYSLLPKNLRLNPRRYPLMRRLRLLLVCPTYTTFRLSLGSHLFRASNRVRCAHVREIGERANVVCRHLSRKAYQQDGVLLQLTAAQQRKLAQPFPIHRLSPPPACPVFLPPLSCPLLPPADDVP